MRIQRFLLFADRVSTWCGKASSWLIIVLTVIVCIEVFKRYILNAPTAWMFDATTMIYGTLFMMCGAYTLAQNGHVRGDFLYGSMKPRTQASLDLALYIIFFLPGIAALVYAGWDYAHASWVIGEHVKRYRRRTARLSFQGRDPHCRHARAAPRPRRDRPLRRLPQDRSSGPSG